MLDYADEGNGSEWIRENGDRMLSAEMQRHYEMAKQIIRNNRDLFDMLVDELVKKSMITFRDIRRIKDIVAAQICDY